jgi:hypothetical protein
VHALAPLIEQDKLNGMVLDLRNNPGGALPAAVAMSELFLAEGDIVSIGSDREDRQNERRTYRAHPGQALEDMPIIVLVDEQSASASEIVAGALGDNERALIVGERSFGKGSVQEVRPLQGDNGMLKFTTAYYYLPSGRNLHRRKGEPDASWGVDPSPGCIVPEDFDAKLERLQDRWMFDAITTDEPAVPDTLDDTWLRDEYHDAALAEAIALSGQRFRKTPTRPSRPYKPNSMWPSISTKPSQRISLNCKMRFVSYRAAITQSTVDSLVSPMMSTLQVPNSCCEAVTEKCLEHGVSRMVRIFGRALMQSNSYQSTNKQRPKNRTPADLPL